MNADYLAFQIGTVNYMSPEAVHKMKGQSVYKVRCVSLWQSEALANYFALSAFIPERCLVLGMYSLPDDLR